MTIISMMRKMSGFFTNRYFLYTIFWAYNGISLFFIGFTGLLLLPQLSGITQNIPWNVAIMGYVLILTPLAAVISGLFTRLRKEPKKLVQLFFCVEIPLIFLALVRIIFIRQLTPILWFFTLGAIVSAAGVVILLFKEKAETKVKQVLQTLSQEIALLLVGYGVFIILFFLPIILVLLYRILSEIKISHLIYALTATKGLAFFSFLFSLLLFVVTVGFFLAAPIVTTVLYYKSFKKSLAHLREMVTPRLVLIFSRGFAFFGKSFGVLLSLQTHSEWYVTQLDHIHQAKTFSEKQALAKPLMEQKESIRGELRSAYLAQYRYIGDATTNIILQGYKEQLHLDSSRAESFQKFFNIIASPFIYQGKFGDDVKNASDRYEEIFDANIQEGERAYIVDALKSTNTRDPLKAGLLDREEKRVRVVTQEVKADVETGSVAMVTFEEEFENTSDQMQEAYYEFSLPEEAVVTGLWLGSNLEYRGVIAPKGAARRTYENQVRERVDPALLEQIGPRQYKLRVFPIPAKIPNWVSNNGVKQEKNQRVKFEYVVSDVSAGIPLPVFGETRNVYSDNKTQRVYSINGQQVTYQEGALTMIVSGSDSCLTKVLQIPVATNLGTVLFLPHSINPLVKDSYHCKTHFGGNVNIPQGKKIALLLDVSQSNSAMNWNKYLKEQLPLTSLLANQNSVDLYYFNDEISDKIPLTQEILEKGLTVIPFGETNRLKALQSLPPEYDAVLMITDHSDFDPGKDTAYALLPKRFPIYLIHPDGQLPALRDDLTYQITMSGGGVFTSLTDALHQFVLANLFQEKHLGIMANQLFPVSVVISVDEKGTWLLSQKTAEDIFPGLNTIPTKPELLLSMNKIAAGVLTKYLIMTSRSMEEIHGTAISNSIVTPYSSFIALVNDGQQRQLEQEKNQANKFQADFDTGVEPLANPMGQAALTIGAVPEPEEWLLIVLGLGLIVFIYRHRFVQLIRR